MVSKHKGHLALGEKQGRWYGFRRTFLIIALLLIGSISLVVWNTYRKNGLKPRELMRSIQAGRASSQLRSSGYYAGRTNVHRTDLDKKNRSLPGAVSPADRCLAGVPDFYAE